ncbi:MAG: DUF2804 domain-containing protein [Polyangiaceae bacterium]
MVSKSVNVSPLEAAPERLVEADGTTHYGRYRTPFAHANLIDAPFHHLPRPIRRLRLKEWQALQLSAPGFFASFALFDAKAMTLVQAKVYESATGKKIAHEWKLRPFAFRLADQIVSSTNTYRDDRGVMTFTNDVADGRIVLEVDLRATRTLPRICGRVEVATDRGAFQVVSLPFEESGSMVSHKGMFPVSGTITVGDRTTRLRPDEAGALLDDHKGYYPYVMRWDWVTSAALRDGSVLGFNLTKNQCKGSERLNENCAWRGDRIAVLPAVTFEREKERAQGETWRIRDREGRVDVLFTPAIPGDVRVNAIIVESRYRGPFGTFRGRIAPEGMEAITLDDWFGMGEDFWLRC